MEQDDRDLADALTKVAGFLASCWGGDEDDWDCGGRFEDFL